MTCAANSLKIRRAAAIGGTLTAAPRERGGVLVRAHVPITAEVAA